MTPATRQALGLPALPADQARRIQEQQQALASGSCARWPAGLHHLAPAAAPPPLYRIELQAPYGTYVRCWHTTNRVDAGRFFIHAVRAGGKQAFVPVFKAGREIDPSTLRGAIPGVQS